MKYVLTYQGGSGMPETEAEMAEVMAAWGTWYEVLGQSVVDGGNPFGPARTIAGDGSVSDGGVLTGYTIIDAAGIDDAVDKAKGCPVLAGGGTVEVSEAIDM